MKRQGVGVLRRRKPTLDGPVNVGEQQQHRGQEVPIEPQVFLLGQRKVRARRPEASSLQRTANRLDQILSEPERLPKACLLYTSDAADE